MMVVVEWSVIWLSPRCCLHLLPLRRCRVSEWLLCTPQIDYVFPSPLSSSRFRIHSHNSQSSLLAYCLNLSGLLSYRSVIIITIKYKHEETRLQLCRQRGNGTCDPCKWMTLNLIKQSVQTNHSLNLTYLKRHAPAPVRRCMSTAYYTIVCTCT